LLILGIDTSCDDTGAAVVEDGRRALSSVVQSQVPLHRPHGGVVPELASREHLKNIGFVVREAMDRAGTDLKGIAGVAVTIGPGLIGSLLVGLYYAKAICFSSALPLLGINHLEGHILSIFLEETVPDFPFLALTVSGGHSSIYLVRDYGGYEELARTIDDAAGEAFDKAAKMMGLGYPGGALIERLAREGSPEKVAFPRPMIHNHSSQFSFSGLKTALSLYYKKWSSSEEERSAVSLADIAASFQEAIIDVLVSRVISKVESTGVKSVVLAGGVACNNRLRTRLGEQLTERGCRLFHPKPAYCMDNGAMIAVAGYHMLMRGSKTDLSIDVRSRYPLSDLSTSIGLSPLKRDCLEGIM
jgi:N6-L-threonylcarbamoyladenine synthase